MQHKLTDKAQHREMRLIHYATRKCSNLNTPSEMQQYRDEPER